MKNGSLVFFFLTISLYPYAQGITGNWQGILLAGPQKLKLVFHIKPDSAHSYLSSFDSPDQHAYGLPCSETRVKGDSLKIGIKLINGGFLGKWNGSDSIAGYFFQSGQNFPMDLSRSSDSEVVVIRPQTPKPPFPYNIEDLEYDNPVSGIHYSGTLTCPKSGGPFAAAILITGSGQQDRDETLFGHKPFAVIADYLTRRGYAVLRVDDRQMGKSTGDVDRATSKDFANDVEDGIHELQGRKEIDQKKIGLIGHSEGGLIASIVGSENANVDFIIMLAGPGLKGSKLLVLQSEAVARSHNPGENSVEASKNLTKLLIDAILYSRDSTVQFEQAWKGYLSWKKTTNPAIVAVMGFSDDTSARAQIRAQLDRMNTPWFVYFLQSDPAEFISRLHCKLLALDGSKDIQVLADQNLAAIETALEKSPSKNYSTEKLPGLNHLFQHCKTCTVEEYGQLEETFAPEALQKMGEWLDKNVK